MCYNAFALKLVELPHSSFPRPRPPLPPPTPSQKHQKIFSPTYALRRTPSVSLHAHRVGLRLRQTLPPPGIEPATSPFCLLRAHGVGLRLRLLHRRHLLLHRLLHLHRLLALLRDHLQQLLRNVAAPQVDALRKQTLKPGKHASNRCRHRLPSKTARSIGLLKGRYPRNKPDKSGIHFRFKV
jgi:hypothetical protein